MIQFNTFSVNTKYVTNATYYLSLPKPEKKVVKQFQMTILPIVLKNQYVVDFESDLLDGRSQCTFPCFITIVGQKQRF